MIELSDYDKRVVALMEAIIPKEVATGAQSREMFNLHNEKFKPRETGINCPACRSRVFNKMKEYYLTLKQE